MTKVTISEAAQRGFASRPTIYRAIKTGSLSAEKKDGQTLIDVSELLRVYGEPSQKLQENETPASVQTVTDDVNREMEALRAQVKELHDLLDRERELAARERQNADRLLGLLETSTKQITDQRPRGLLHKLFG